MASALSSPGWDCDASAMSAASREDAGLGSARWGPRGTSDDDDPLRRMKGRRRELVMGCDATRLGVGP